MTEYQCWDKLYLEYGVTSKIIYGEAKNPFIRPEYLVTFGA